MNRALYRLIFRYQQPALPLDVRGTINSQNQGVLKFSSRVQLQADDNQYRVLTGAAVKTNRHLPGISSAEQIAADGMDLGRLNAKLLR